MMIVGTGGQGLITLLQIIAEAAKMEGKDVRTSELHGLAQRGGSVEVHIRFGEKVFAPLVSQGRADFILGLEMQEALKAHVFASDSTVFLINKNFIPIPLSKPISEEDIIKNIKKISKEAFLVPAAEICQKELGSSVVSGIYLVSLAVCKQLIPLKPESLEKAIRKMIPESYLELNLKTFRYLQLQRRQIFQEPPVVLLVQIFLPYLSKK